MKPILYLTIFSFLLQSCNPTGPIVNSTAIPSTGTLIVATEAIIPASPVTTSSPTSGMVIALHEGVFSFQVVLGADDTGAVFDFDTNKPQTNGGNDIGVGISQGTNIFITALPLNGASAYPLKRSSESTFRDFNYDECLQEIDGFKAGGRPLAPDGYFCWKSSEGRLAEFVVQKAYKSANGSFVVEIKYIVWDKVLK